MKIDPTWLNHLEIQIGELLFDELLGLTVVVTGFHWEKGRVKVWLLFLLEHWKSFHSSLIYLKGIKL